jgi:Domain of unknown function (DUF5615)
LAPEEPNQPHSSDKANDQGDEPFAVLLDQNVPRSICEWLRQEHPGWRVWHVVEVGLAGKSDRQVYEWAQTAHALIVTFDEDFADQRLPRRTALRGGATARLADDDRGDPVRARPAL